MKDKIYQGFKTNIKEVLTKINPMVFAFSIIGLILFSLLYFVFGVMEYSNNAIWVFFLDVLAFVGLCYVTFPFLYGVSLSVADGCRFEKKKHSFASLFTSYYKGNRGVFSLWSCFWKAFVCFVAVSFISIVIIFLVLRYGYPSLWDSLYSMVEDINAGGTVNVVEYLGDNYRTFEIMIMLCIAFPTLGFVTMWEIEMRRSECVFYCATSIISDNQVNMATGGLQLLFKREVMPTVKKEHAKYDLMINWIGYVVFFSSYLLFILLGCFVKSIPAFLVPFIGLVISCVLYSPFYVVTRTYDNLFYIAYSDKIMDRINPNVREILLKAKSAIIAQFHLNKEDENYDDKGTYDGSESSDSNSKKGSSDLDGALDFTSKDEQNKDDDDKPKGDGE